MRHNLPALYDRLAAEERLEAVVHARIRRDETEERRLMDSITSPDGFFLFLLMSAHEFGLLLAWQAEAMLADLRQEMGMRAVLQTHDEMMRALNWPWLAGYAEARGLTETEVLKDAALAERAKEFASNLRVAYICRDFEHLSDLNEARIETFGEARTWVEAVRAFALAEFGASAEDVVRALSPFTGLCSWERLLAVLAKSDEGEVDAKRRDEEATTLSKAWRRTMDARRTAKET